MIPVTSSQCQTLMAGGFDRTVEAYLANSLARGHSRATVAYRRVYLGQLQTWLTARGIGSVHAVTARSLEDYVTCLENRQTAYMRKKASLLSVHTLATEVSVLRSLFAWLAASGTIAISPATDLRLHRRSPTPAKAVLSIMEVEALLDAPGIHCSGLRDRAILETLYSTGIRRAEVCGLDCYDVEWTAGVVWVRGAKGGRDRVVPIGTAALAAIRRYVRQSRPYLIGSPKETALFVGGVSRSRLKVKTLNPIILRHAAAAGIKKRVTPHVLRHTCATHLLQGGAGVRDVQAILGHVVLGTTQIYTRVTDDDLVAAHQRHHPRDGIHGLERAAPMGVCSKKVREVTSAGRQREVNPNSAADHARRKSRRFSRGTTQGRTMITKSDLQSLRQCPRKLWLEHHRTDLIPENDPAVYRRAMDGNIVGAKAREQLGGDFIWPPGDGDKAQAAENARQILAAAPDRRAAEVPFVRDGLYARADALVPEPSGYVLRETKASTFPLKKDKVTPADPEEHHLDDVAIQLWVMESSGFKLARAELNLLDNRWRYPGGGDYAGLFRQLDISAAVRALKPSVPLWLTQASEVVTGGMPAAVTGKQCKQPYPCPFTAFCEPQDPPKPPHPIELLPDSAGKLLAKKLHETKGYVSLLEPAPAELTGKAARLYQRIQLAHQSGKAMLETGAAELLSTLNYPRYYFDFEGIDLPVPRWSGVRSYEHIPFQWSCHVERTPGDFEHAEFLDLTGNDPSLNCIAKMREVIDPDDGGPILVYYATYERGRLEGLATRHPEHSELLQEYIDRLVDLHPLVKEHFYHPAMRGSFSIKKVLAVIAPDLDYADLDEVQEGTGAQVAYLYAVLDPTVTPQRKADLENKLRVYCAQDTWAMVEVAYFLAGSGRPKRPPMSVFSTEPSP